MSAVRHSANDDLGAPCQSAIPYMMTPARKKRTPAMRSGGIDSIASRMPR